MQYDRQRIMTMEASIVERLGAAAPNLHAELLDYLQRHRATLDTDVRSAGASCGVPASTFAARMYDGLLDTLFRCVATVVPNGKMANRRALGAVGSYGRGILGLHSDVDVRLIVDRDDEHAESLARALLYPLWDARVSVGYQVVDVPTLVELAATDLRTATTILDWRHLSGDTGLTRELAEQVESRVFEDGNATAFIERLEVDTAVRHDRFGASVYLLEPDIKQGAGGLRDLDVALWVAKARWKVSRFEDLVRLGVFVPRELVELQNAQLHIWRVRNQLHLLAGRRNDRLSFDRQEQLAASLGFGDDLAGPERLMSEHYQHAQRISHALEVIVGRALEPRVPEPVRRITPGLVAAEDHVAIESASALAFEPRLALSVYQHAVLRRRRVHPNTREILRRALKMPGFRTSLLESPDAHGAFLSLCTTIRETRLRHESPLGDMHDVGLLTTFVPEFSPLVGRVHHDVYHVLTVDAHSIAAVDLLRRLARGQTADPHGVVRRLATEMVRPQILFLAVLLHDVGKAIGRRDHATRGAPIAFDVARRFGLSGDDAHEVAHLVRHHLVLYHLATRRDVDDPDVFEEVARIAHGREGLCELLLLTYVDVSTTSPDAMTEWKATLLERLFLNVEAHMLGDSVAASRGASVRSRIDRMCRRDGAPDDALKAFLLSMPERYVLGTAEERVLAHAKLASRRARGTVRAAVFPTHAGVVAEIAVIADDKPGLLASIAAALTANRLSVLEAQIHSRTREDGTSEAVDVFQISAADGTTLDDVRRLMPRVEKNLLDILSGQTSAEALVQPRLLVTSGRASPAVRTEVVVDNRASSTLTVVEAFTRDRPGLLYVLAKTFRDLALSIQLAKINTEGTRVADVFYVCDSNGAKVTSGPQVETIERRLRESLEQPWEGS